MTLHLLSFPSYWKDLFTVEDVGDVYALTFLPYLVTGIAIGVILGGLYYAFWRTIESTFLYRLKTNSAVGDKKAVTLETLGYKPGRLRYRVVRRLLRSPHCFLYKTISVDELDHIENAPQSVLEPSPREAQTELTDAAEAIELPLQDAFSDQLHTSGKPRQRAAAPRRLTISDDARFYIRVTSMEYAERHAIKLTHDNFTSLLFSILICLVVWFILMNSLDPFIALLHL
jgi:hypothetical protein